MPRIYRPVVLGVAVAILATIVLTSPSQAGPPPANGQFPQGATVKLVNVGSGLCASPAGGSSALNGAVVQYYCDADPARLWELVPSRWYDANNPVYQIMDEKSGMCLSPAGGSIADRTPIVQYYCDDDYPREWILYPTWDGHVLLENNLAPDCLTVDPGAGANAGLIQSGCDGPEAGWQISTGDLVRNTHSTLCAAPAGPGLNATVIQGACVDSYRISVDGGTLLIRDTSNQLCLSPAGGGTAWNTVIVQYHCDADPARHWTVTRRAGAYEIRNVHSNLCLSPAGGATTAGTPIVQYPCDGDPSRLWTLIPEPTAFIHVGG